MSGQYEMLLEQNTDVPMRDGAILRANVYRPNAGGRFPVLMTFGPYGKDVPLREFMQEALDRLNTTYPEILAASSCKHLVFERPATEIWVPDGYIVINVDSRGAGKSPGRLDPNSPAEFCDFYAHRYRPVSDDDGPVHNNPHQMEQRHHGEDHPGHKRKRFCVHEPSSQIS